MIDDTLEETNGGRASFPAIAAVEVRDLVRTYGRSNAVDGISFTVRPGTCFGFFGRNGTCKTTTIKCLLNLLRPNSGLVRIFGLDPASHEVAIKQRIAYVPDSAAFYPWMTIRQTLDYFASLCARWDRDVEAELLERFRLDPAKRATALSKGQTMELALITAICPGPELLILDEPTTGLDPVIRREFVEAVVSSFRRTDPERRTIFVSTHLISEFENIIDDFAIIENGRVILSSRADEARARFHRVRVRFSRPPAQLKVPGLVECRGQNGDFVLVVSGDEEPAVQYLKSHAPESLIVEELDLEGIFLALLSSQSKYA
jgi:ABC-type multidrug transport system ATPase subunit